MDKFGSIFPPDACKRLVNALRILTTVTVVFTACCPANSPRYKELKILQLGWLLELVDLTTLLIFCGTSTGCLDHYLQDLLTYGAETNCRIAHLLVILLMISYWFAFYFSDTIVVCTVSIYKSLHNQVPSYLSDLITLNRPIRTLPSSTKSLLQTSHHPNTIYDGKTRRGRSPSLHPNFGTLYLSILSRFRPSHHFKTPLKT